MEEDDSIIIIKPVEFYSRKDAVHDVLSTIKIQEKYANLFKDYICFSDTAVVVIQPNLPFKIIKKSYNGNHHGQHHSSQNSSHHNRKEPKTVKKFITGILNVMNSDNYKKMLLKIKIYINNNNIHEIFTEIIDKSISQIFYIKNYINLIKDLTQSLTEQDRSIGIEIINKFVSTFINDKQYILDVSPMNSPSNHTSDQYNKFCKTQKMKTIILSKHAMIIELFQQTNLINADTLTMQDYCYLIYNSFMEYINIDNEIADILLQMLIELSKQGQKFNCEYFKTITVNNSKINFLIQDLIDIHASQASQHAQQVIPV